MWADADAKLAKQSDTNIQSNTLSDLERAVTYLDYSWCDASIKTGSDQGLQVVFALSSLLLVIPSSFRRC